MEVGSETGMMASREPFTQSQPSMQSMRLAFTPDGTAIYKHVSPPPSFPAEPQPVGSRGLNASNVTTGEAVKRKRGRPRKYGPDGAVNVGLSPLVAPQVSGGFSSPVGVNSASSPGGVDAGGLKKGRGRPPGSRKKQQMSGLGSAGTGFVPHVVIVKTGEDISSKIMSFLQNGPRTVCILSANGAVSNVTLRQSTISSGTVTYEGRFEILALSGSFHLSESSGQRSRTGGLSVSLASSDGRVLGGGVAGLLTAASPVQVVVGSFLADGRKESKALTQLETVSGANLLSAGAMGGAGSPTSRGTMSESSGGPGSSLNQNKGGCSNGNQQSIPNMPWKLS